MNTKKISKPAKNYKKAGKKFGFSAQEIENYSTNYFDWQIRGHFNALIKYQYLQARKESLLGVQSRSRQSSQNSTSDASISMQASEETGSLSDAPRLSILSMSTEAGSAPQLPFREEDDEDASCEPDQASLDELKYQKSDPTDASSMADFGDSQFRSSLQLNSPLSVGNSSDFPAGSKTRCTKQLSLNLEYCTSYDWISTPRSCRFQPQNILYRALSIFKSN